MSKVLLILAVALGGPLFVEDVCATSLMLKAQEPITDEVPEAAEVLWQPPLAVRPFIPFIAEAQVVADCKPPDKLTPGVSRINSAHYLPHRQKRFAKGIKSWVHRDLN